MKNVRVGLKAFAIGRLEIAQLLRLWFMRIDRKVFVNEKIPNFFAPLASVERLILSVADAPEFAVDGRWFGAVATAHQLHHPFALVDLLTQHLAQVAAFRAEDVLPRRLVAEKHQRIDDELARASQLLANRGSENEGAWRHFAASRIKLHQQ